MTLNSPDSKWSRSWVPTHSTGGGEHQKRRKREGRARACPPHRLRVWVTPATCAKSRTHKTRGGQVGQPPQAGRAASMEGGPFRRVFSTAPLFPPHYTGRLQKASGARHPPSGPRPSANPRSLACWRGARRDSEATGGPETHQAI